jgi:hypothetical protein
MQPGVPDGRIVHARHIVQESLFIGEFILSLKTLAEAVIIQSAKDIMDKHQYEESVHFLEAKASGYAPGWPE